MPQPEMTAHAVLRETDGSVLLAAAHGLFRLTASSGEPPDNRLSAGVDSGPARRPTLTELGRIGLLRGSPFEDRFAAATITVLGSGRLARQIVEDLVLAGVDGLVLWDNEPPDLTVYETFTRATGAQSLKSWLVGRHGYHWGRRAVVVNHWTKPEYRRTDVTIVATDYVEVDRAITDGLLRADQPHLFVRPYRRGVVLGPLVVPGRSPCMRCLDLARTARNRLWPTVLPRLSQVRQSTDLVWARWAASQIVVSVGAFLRDGSCDLLGATAEICAEEPSVAVRRWSVHTECGCDLIETS